MDRRDEQEQREAEHHDLTIYVHPSATPLMQIDPDNIGLSPTR
jgi:hypothetical protein